MIIYFAILLHKIPASIGLGTFLKGKAVDDIEAFKCILAFTLSSPISTIVCYLSLSAIPYTSDKLNLPLLLAVLLLISAGTFLYVATIHILPATLSHDKKMTKGEVATLCLSMLFPFILH